MRVTACRVRQDNSEAVEWPVPHPQLQDASVAEHSGIHQAGSRLQCFHRIAQRARTLQEEARLSIESRLSSDGVPSATILPRNISARRFAVLGLFHVMCGDKTVTPSSAIW